MTGAARPTAYLAGPDVFLPNAAAHAARKVAVCARYGIIGRAPLNEDVEALATMSDEDSWRTIFAKDLALMEACDLVIANLSPFRGPSADAGTLVELGWFLGRGRPVFGYSNTATPFAARSAAHVALFPDPVPGLSVEGFGLPDNLMVAGAVLFGGGHPLVLPPDGLDRPLGALDVFECCVRICAHSMRRGWASSTSTAATPARGAGGHAGT